MPLKLFWTWYFLNYSMQRPICRAPDRTEQKKINNKEELRWGIPNDKSRLTEESFSLIPLSAHWASCQLLKRKFAFSFQKYLLKMMMISSSCSCSWSLAPWFSLRSCLRGQPTTRPGKLSPPLPRSLHVVRLVMISKFLVMTMIITMMIATSHQHITFVSRWPSIISNTKWRFLSRETEH